MNIGAKACHYIHLYVVDSCLYKRVVLWEFYLWVTILAVEFDLEKILPNVFVVTCLLRSVEVC